MNPLTLPTLLGTLLVLGVLPTTAPQISTRTEPAGFRALRLLPGDRSLAPAAGVQEEPQVAVGAQASLVVWTDRRTSFSTLVPSESEGEVYAARVDLQGVLLDPLPIVVSTQEFGEQEQPQVAWDGQHWLVVWRNQAPTTFFYTSEIRAARVAPDGTVVDDPPLSLHTYSNSTSSVLLDVTPGPSGWTVLIFDASAGGILGQRIAPDGTLVDPSPVLLVPTVFYPAPIELTYAETSGVYLLLWNDFSGNVRANRFGAGLSPLEPASLSVVTSGDPSGFSVADDGSDFFLAWIADGPGSQSFVRGTRITAGGAILDPGGLEISGDFGLFTPDEGDLAWDGSSWIVSWGQRGMDVFLSRVSAGGAVLDFGGVPFRPSPSARVDQHALDPLFGGGVRVAWKDTREGGPSAGDVHAADADAGLAAGPEVVVSLGTPSQTQPDLAPGDRSVLVTFVSETSATRRVVVQRVTEQGLAIDAEPIELAAGDLLEDPRAAWDGTRWLVVWADRTTGTILGRRVAANGSPLDPSPLVVMEGITPEVAAIPGVFLVVCTDTPFSPEFRFPFARRVDGATGALLDPAPLQLGQHFAQLPSVAPLGGGWIVTWQRNFTHDDPRANVHFALVAADGSSAGDDPLNGQLSYDPAVASSGGQAVILWRDDLDGATREDLFAQRVEPDGAILDATPVLVSAEDQEQSDPAAGWSGSAYVFAWEDQRDAAVFYDERDELFGARLSPAGTLLDPDGFRISTTRRPAVQPVVAGSAGRVFLGGAFFTVEQGYHSYRVGLRVQAPPPAQAGPFSGR